MRGLLAFIVALFMSSWALDALAQTEAVAASPINLAGEQRMLSQRIAKLYSQVGLNVLPSLATNQLRVATNRFDVNLTALKGALAGSPEATRACEQLAGTWKSLKDATAAPVSREAAQALAKQAEITLVAAEQLARVVQDQGRSETGRLVNLAGRQRMLSQRIANNYLLRSWGVESAAVRDNLASSVKDFSAGLASLSARTDNSPEIRRELEEIAQQWEWLQASMAVEGASSYRLIVAESADAILEATDRVTRLYEQQNRR